MGNRLVMKSLVMAGSLMLAVGCSSDDPDLGLPPELPDLASMQADLSFFDSGASLDGSGASVGAHFLTAAFTVTVARAATVVATAIPTATFAAAFQVTPVFEDGDWHWRYGVTEGAAQYEADLAGRVDGNQTVWSMSITSTGVLNPLSDFTWYSGRAQIGGGSGEWHIFDPTQSSSVELLDIDWLNPAAGVWTLSFTNVNPGAGAEQGDVLSFEVDGDDHSVRYSDASEGEEIVIFWDRASGEGYIEAPGYNDGVRACWDSVGNNVVCLS